MHAAITLTKDHQAFVRVYGHNVCDHVGSGFQAASHVHHCHTCLVTLKIAEFSAHFVCTLVDDDAVSSDGVGHISSVHSWRATLLCGELEA